MPSELSRGARRSSISLRAPAALPAAREGEGAEGAEGVQRGEIALPCNMQRRCDCSVRVPPYVYGALYAFIFYPIAIAARCSVSFSSYGGRISRLSESRKHRARISGDVSGTAKPRASSAFDSRARLRRASQRRIIARSSSPDPCISPCSSNVGSLIGRIDFLFKNEARASRATCVPRCWQVHASRRDLNGTIRRGLDLPICSCSCFIQLLLHGRKVMGEGKGSDCNVSACGSFCYRAARRRNDVNSKGVVHIERLDLRGFNIATETRSFRDARLPRETKANRSDRFVKYGRN